ncbi:hypothetical protein BT69DRAFT_1284373 [Atractiella rhizophila]|nr:hypothetical protein BT69DRAFT_1284373 [Atractiella rhizophila]
MFSQLGERYKEAKCIYGLGRVALKSGQNEDARKSFNTARTIFWELGEREDEAWSICQSGFVDLKQNDNNAREAFDTAKATFSELGNRLGEQSALLDWDASTPS